MHAAAVQLAAAAAAGAGARPAAAAAGPLPVGRSATLNLNGSRAVAKLVDVALMGVFPATVVKEIAECFEYDLAHPEEAREPVQILARLGGTGATSSNRAKQALFKRFPITNF